MRLYEILGYDCGSGIHYDPVEKNIRTDKKVRAKITLRGLRKMNLLKKRQSKINKQKSKLLSLMYGTGPSEAGLATGEMEIKSQNHIDNLAMHYIKKSF